MIVKCLSHNKAIPAIETLNDRKDLPRRYWMFYDLFFCPGLQKKEYVKELITQKEGDRELRFGTCSFEAHVHSVIEQNYFVWLYDILTDPFWDIGNTSLLSSFSTEYDKDYVLTNKEEGICSLFMPKNIEISYSEENKDYVILDCNNNEEEDDVNEATANQIKVINNKISAVQNHSDRVDKMALLKVELINHLRATKDNTNNNEKSISQKRRQVKKKLQNLVDIISRPKRKRGCQHDVKIIDFFQKRNKIEMEEKSGLRLKWERIFKKICRTHIVGDDLDEKDGDDYLSKMGINKNDCINELEELNTFGIQV